MKESLKQYIDLYKENAAELDGHSADVLNACRAGACVALEAGGLPAAGSENWEVTDLDAILAPDYGVNIRRVPLQVDPAQSFKCGVPWMSTALFLMVNDRFALTSGFSKSVPEGVEVCGLADMARRHPEVVEKYYNRLADPANVIASLSTLLAQDGVWIRVKRGVRLEKPLQLVNILGGAERMLVARRIVIVMEEDSEAKLLMCDHTAEHDASFLSLQGIEIFAGKGSSFDCYDLEETSPQTSRLSTLWLRQEENSAVVINGMTISNGKTRNEYHCTFAAKDSSLRLYGMGIADIDRMIDNYSVVRHDCGHCHTEELFKYSVDDDARCAFTGMVRVAEGAVRTKAYQSNRNLIGSDNARMFSKPQLEIYNDDVECSHGSANGRLDGMQLFYMRTRGLDEKTARLLLKQAFMADVIGAVRIPGLKERLTQMVERRFAGIPAGCRGQSNSVSPNLAEK